MKEYKGLIVTKIVGPSPCAYCRKVTKFVDIHFEAPMCSIKCANAMWLEYEEACRQSDELYANQNLGGTTL